MFTNGRGKPLNNAPLEPNIALYNKARAIMLVCHLKIPHHVLILLVKDPHVPVVLGIDEVIFEIIVNNI